MKEYGKKNQRVAEKLYNRPMCHAWFSISTKSMDYKTLNQPVKQVQGMVQGDK